MKVGGRRRRNLGLPRLVRKCKYVSQAEGCVAAGAIVLISPILSRRNGLDYNKRQLINVSEDGFSEIIDMEMVHLCHQAFYGAEAYSPLGE